MKFSHTNGIQMHDFFIQSQIYYCSQPTNTDLNSCTNRPLPNLPTKYNTLQVLEISYYLLLFLETKV